jgi:hypothetical protein
LNKGSCLAEALGVIDSQMTDILFWSRFVVLLRSDFRCSTYPPQVFEEKKYQAWLQLLGLTKLTFDIQVNVTLCCAAMFRLECSTNPPLLKKLELSCSLGVTKFITSIAKNLVTLCGAG